MPRLVIFQEDGKGGVFELTDEATVGRSSDNTIPLVGGKQISRTHARFVRKGDKFYVKDTGSRNGVFVNGRKIVEHPLNRGDKIEIGSAMLVFDPEFDLQTQEGTEGSLVVLPAVDDDKATAMLQAYGRDEAEETQIGPAADSDQLAVAHRRLQAVYEVTNAVSSILEESQLLPKLLDTILDTMNAERAAVIYCTDDAREVKPGCIRSRGNVSTNLSLSRTILNQVLQERRSVLSGDAANDPRFDASQSIRMDQVRSVLCAPLVHKERLLGAIYVDTQDILRSFDHEDLTLLVNISRQAAIALDNARAYTRTREEVSQLRRRIAEDVAIIGEHPRIREVLDRVAKVANLDSTVLVTGETGTGKELVAQGIHLASARRSKSLVPVDCTAISESLLESELFGHEKGAFTGADRQKPGKFEVADGGTLFLDEIGDMDPGTQQKLLRVLEEKKFTRVGGVKLISVDVRIIAATNRNLEEAVKAGKFREDLFYRLAVVPIQLPALRERSSDIPILARHFLRRFAAQSAKRVLGITPEAMKILENYRWPGNIREMRNLIERAVVLCDKETIDVEDFPPSVVGSGMAMEMSSLLERDLPLSDIVAQVERSCIARALEKSHGKKSEASRMLDISRPTLDKKMKEFGLEGGHG